MSSADFIRLGIIAVAMLFGYYAIVNLIDFISSLPARYSIGGGPVSTGVLLRFACFVLASWIIIKYNRKIARFIDDQK